MVLSVAVAALAYPVLRAGSAGLAIAYVMLVAIGAAMSGVEHGGLLAMRAFSEAFAASGDDQALFESFHVVGALMRNGMHHLGLLISGFILGVWVPVSVSLRAAAKGDCRFRPVCRGPAVVHDQPARAGWRRELHLARASRPGSTRSGWMVVGERVSRKSMMGKSCQRRAGAFTLSLALLLPSSVFAHLPEFFGREYVLVKDGEPPPDPCGGDRDALRAEIEAQKERLDSQPPGDGAYDITLADPQGELAGLYAQLCNHPAALKQLREALQRLRISDGLLAPSQLPILRAMADSYLAIGDFESAQLALRSALRVHGMAVGSLSAEGLRDSLAYFRLARNNFIDPRWSRDVGLFFQAFQDNDEAWDRQLERKTAYEVLRGLGLSQLRNYYILMGTNLSSGVVGSEAGGATWDFLYRAQLLSYRQGIDILEVLTTTAEEFAPQHVAEVSVPPRELAYVERQIPQCLRGLRDGLVSCNAAWGKRALREQMAQPAELPEDQALWDALQSPDIPERAVIEASFQCVPGAVMSLGWMPIRLVTGLMLWPVAWGDGSATRTCAPPL